MASNLLVFGSLVKDINLFFALPKVYGDEKATHMTLVEPKVSKKDRVNTKIIKQKFRNHIKK